MVNPSEKPIYETGGALPFLIKINVDIKTDFVSKYE
jgi:hypothetical protein